MGLHLVDAKLIGNSSAETGSYMVQYGLSDDSILVASAIPGGLERDIMQYCALYGEDGNLAASVHDFGEIGYINRIDISQEHLYETIKMVSQSISTVVQNMEDPIKSKLVNAIRSTNGPIRQLLAEQKVKTIYTDKVPNYQAKI